jgi:hypothetical protein
LFTNESRFVSDHEFVVASVELLDVRLKMVFEIKGVIFVP